jgi:hypothetical protein
VTNDHPSIQGLHLKIKVVTVRRGQCLVGKCDEIDVFRLNAHLNDAGPVGEETVMFMEEIFLPFIHK